MSSLRNCLLLSCTVVLVAAANYANAQSWKKHRDFNYGFEVEFSGAVQIKPPNLDTKGEQNVERAIVYMQTGSSFVYTVGAQLNKGDLVDFDKSTNGAIISFACKTIISDIPLGLQRGRGRELQGANCYDGTLSILGRYFTTGKWFYQVVAVFKTNGGDEKAARYFLQSFKTISK